VSSLQEIAGELYGLPLEAFIPRRNELAKQLRSQDRELAEAVRRLPKPAQPAWAVNMFSRRRTDQVTSLLALGTELREAQEDLAGEALRELTAQARPAVRQALQAAVEVAADHNVTLGESAQRQVEQTLRAALADEQAARAVQVGVLVRTLKPVGFGVDVDGALAVTPSAKPSTDARATKKDSGARERRREAQQAAKAALKDLENAERDLRRHQERLDEVQEAASAATSRAQALREELAQAERDAAEAVSVAREARRERDAGRTAQRAASRRSERAQKSLDKLN
jgi:hypothetical protein